MPRLLSQALRASSAPILFGFRLWAAVCLALFVAFWLELENASWAGTTAALVCQPRLGASMRNGWFRVVGTVVGAGAIVLLSAAFPQDRAAFLIGLALLCGASAFVAAQLGNASALSASLVTQDHWPERADRRGYRRVVAGPLQRAPSAGSAGGSASGTHELAHSCSASLRPAEPCLSPAGGAHSPADAAVRAGGRSA
ncbi:MAG: hypothetical protein B7Z15_12100 [Rhizobiales bacterium 32-66-8]|nr:MAG: hypothetical protein B7Z15_12100 [Rhizobiales bacterium 32-66-8]